MSDQPIDYQKQEELRYRMETSKERAILIRNWIYTAIALIVTVMLVWALWSWKAANNMAGATSAKLNGILDKLDSKINTLQTENINGVLAEVQGAIADLRKTERELPGLVTDVRQEIVGLSRTVQGRLVTLDSVMAESRNQIKQNGDETARLIRRTNDEVLPSITDAVRATNTLMAKFGATADEAALAIKSASEKTGRSIDELNKQIADPRWGQAADNLVTATDTANLALSDFHTDLHDTMKQMPHIMAQVDKTATNIRKFSKVSIVAGIISNLANGFIPGFLH
jgi:hypothetical protein